MPLIGLAVGGVTAITSGIRAYKAHKALKELQKQELPNYSVIPEMNRAYNRAEGMAGRGFTGAEEAAFKSNLAQEGNTAYRNALDQSGGGMSQAILGGINSRNIGALNQFAGQDAQLHRQNIQYADQLAGQNQAQQNLATGQEINYRMAQEQAYGKAQQDALNSGISGINYGLTMGLGGGFGENRASAGPQGFGYTPNNMFAAGGNPAQPTYMLNPAYQQPQPFTPMSGISPQPSFMLQSYNYNR